MVLMLGQMADTEIDMFLHSTEIGGGVDDPDKLVSKGKHPSDPFLSSNSEVGSDLEGYVAPPS